MATPRKEPAAAVRGIRVGNNVMREALLGGLGRVLKKSPTADGDTVLREAVAYARDHYDATFDTNKLRASLFAIFGHLESEGMGDYKQGRKGHKTRFLSLASSASELVAALEGEAPLDAREAAGQGESGFRKGLGPAIGLGPGRLPQTIDHRFVLRPELTLSLPLPGDLSRGEAARLARFIEALPFD